MIARPSRGMYTTLEHYAESKKRMEEERKARSSDLEALLKSFAHGATVTTDANTIDHPDQDICTNFPVLDCAHLCHPERSEGSHAMGTEILR